MLLSWHLHPTISTFSEAEVEAGNPSEGSQTPCHHACLKVFCRSKTVFSSLISPYKPHIFLRNCWFVLPLPIFSLFSKVLLRSLHVFCQAACKIPLHLWFAPTQREHLSSGKIIPDSFKTFTGLSGAFNAAVIAVPSTHRATLYRTYSLWLAQRCCQWASKSWGPLVS